MEGVYAWIRSIVCYLCLFQIFLQILPGKDFKKYVQFFGGLVLILLVIEPLADRTQLNEQFERTWRMGSLREQADDLRITGEGLEELRSEKINEAYRMEMKRQIEEVARVYGIEPRETEILFDGEKGEGLGIWQVNLTVVQPEGADGTAVAEMKKELREVYHISPEQINIVAIPS